MFLIDMSVHTCSYHCIGITDALGDSLRYHMDGFWIIDKPMTNHTIKSPWCSIWAKIALYFFGFHFRIKVMANLCYVVWLNSWSCMHLLRACDKPSSQDQGTVEVEWTTAAPNAVLQMACNCFVYSGSFQEDWLIDKGPNSNPFCLGTESLRSLRLRISSKHASTWQNGTDNTLAGQRLCFLSLVLQTLSP